MREFAKSVMRFTWSMTVFGTKQMFDLVRSQGSGEKLHETTDAFDNVTQAAEGEMEDVTKSVFRFGDNLQKSMVDMMFGVIPFGGASSNSPDAMMSNMFRQSADVMRKGINLAQETAGSFGGAVQNAASGQQSEKSSSGWGPVPADGGVHQTQAPPVSDPPPSTGGGWGPMPTQSSGPNTKK